MDLSLSSTESEFLADREFLLAKRSVVEKNVALLYQLQAVLSDWEKQLPESIQEVTKQSREGKVSVGENYEGLPYQIFDYPRVFTTSNTFALRTMIWWGHHISLVLHIGGDLWQAHKRDVLPKVFALDKVCVGVADDPWAHHFRPDNFRELSTLTDESRSRLAEKSFLKVGKRWPLTMREQIPLLVQETSSDWLSLF